MGTGSFVPVRAFICVVRHSVRLLSVLRSVRDRRPFLALIRRAYFFRGCPALGDRAQKSVLRDRLYISNKCLLISTGYIINILV